MYTLKKMWKFEISAVDNSMLKLNYILISEKKKKNSKLYYIIHLLPDKSLENGNNIPTYSSYFYAVLTVICKLTIYHY